eukprot:351451-Chlamydomonas_euryale.AAC.2
MHAWAFTHGLAWWHAWACKEAHPDAHVHAWLSLRDCVAKHGRTHTQIWAVTVTHTAGWSVHKPFVEAAGRGLSRLPRPRPARGWGHACT